VNNDDVAPDADSSRLSASPPPAFLPIFLFIILVTGMFIEYVG
jgi:hypothetical protein